MDMKNSYTIIIFILLALVSWYLFSEFSLRNYIFLIPILFAIQILLNDLLESYLNRKLKERYFSIVIAPGTIVHEISHAFAAKITGCKIKGISFFSPDQRGGVLGFVEYIQPRDRFHVIRNLLIGFAPFFGCGIFLIALFNYLAQQNPDISLISPDLVKIEDISGILPTMISIMEKFYEQLIFLDLSNPIILLILYLEFSISLGTAPSSKDFGDFFHSIAKYKLQTIIIILLIISIILLTEYAPDEYGISCIMVLAFKWMILILMISLSLLLISIPLTYTIINITEIRGVYKIIPVLSFLLIYFFTTKILNSTREISLISSVIFFLTSLFILRYPRFFIKPK
ncbi:MAG: hypothetical protein DRO76_01670 [Candidatus Altiarchaeales archaeon]|nr:MAG: hypothetical protein DRO76_01670 [Candidatus Altiarchaeales archaeon]HDI72832.1 hypothetical protein [Candidatus Altiarchaeales archaeon]